MLKKESTSWAMEVHNSDIMEAFTFYRLNAKHRNLKNTPRPEYHRTIVSAFWKKVGEKMIESKGGVVVDNFGYFSIGMVPENRIPYKKGKKGRHINAHTKSKVYFPLFIPNLKNKTMKVFTMDRAFSSNKIKKPLSNKLKQGFKYLNYFEEIYKTFFNRYRKANNR